MSFKQKTLSGLSWSFASQWLNFFLGFGFSVLLARLLSPVEFGLIAMAQVFIGISKLFLSLGFSGALIQKKEITQREKSTVYWFILFNGFILTAILFSTSTIIADFYETPQIESIIKVLSFVFIIKASTSLHSTLLIREIKFKQLSLISLSNSVLSNILALILVLYNYGVWALVGRELFNSVFGRIVMWRVVKWRPSFVFNFSDLKANSKFGLGLFGNQILAYFGRNTDNLIIGKFLGEGALGLYKKAYNTLTFPISKVSDSLQRVMFPSFSSIQEDKEKIKRIFLKISRFVFLIVAPMMIFLVINSEELVILLFGEQWNGMIPIIQVLGILAIIQTLERLLGSVLNSQGYSVLLFKINLIQNIVIVFSFIFGILIGGLMGLVYSYAVISTLVIYIKFNILIKVISLKFKRYLSYLYPIIFPIFIFTICTMIFSNRIINFNDYLVNIFLNILVSFSIYLLILYFKKIEEFALLVNLIFKK